jgi:hypothetical protein
LETASTSAAPAADAGSPNDHGSPHQTGNSAGNGQSDPQRQERGAHSSNQKQAKPKQAAKQSEPDDDQKRKRSEVLKRQKEIQAGAQKAWKERQEYEARLQKREERLKKLGLDPSVFDADDETQVESAFEKAAQERLAKKLEEATLEPSELERRKLKAENERLVAAEQERQREQQKQEYTRQVEQASDAIAGHFATALQEHNLPANEGVVWRMASLLSGARKSGQQISLPGLAEKTKQWVTRDVRAVVKEGGPKALKGILDPSDYQALREDIRKELLSEQQSKFSTPQPKREPPKVLSNPKHPNGYITFDEMMSAKTRR